MALLTLTTTLLMATPGDEQEKHIQRTVDLGKSSATLLLQTLGKNMKANMKSGGVMNALNFCSQEAFTLTDKVNTQLEKGVEVKRISLKYRNPANAPQGNEIKILNSFENLKNENVILPKFLVEYVDASTYKYYQPIVIDNAVCLKCHGNVSENPELQKAIAEKYPMDKATGYKMNDVRGAVVVTVKH